VVEICFWSLQQGVVFFGSKEFQYPLPALFDPFCGHGHKTEDELLQPEVGLYKIQFFTDAFSEEVV